MDQVNIFLYTMAWVPFFDILFSWYPPLTVSVDIAGYFSNMAPSKGDKRGNVKKKNKSKSAKQRMRSIKRLLSKVSKL